MIEAEIRRLEQSLQSFLDFARPPRPERQDVDLVPLVEETLNLVRGRASRQRVSLEFEHAAGARLWADRAQLRQVFVNLELNALDAMPHGGELFVQLTRLPHEGVEISFRDSGGGIAPDILPRLFEPFVSGKQTGLGLGLVISRRIVEDHGGTLVAVNRPAASAEFVVRLPTAGGGTRRLPGNLNAQDSIAGH